jgi:putative phosphoesterase
MSQSIAVISDTHLYDAQVPQWVQERITRSDYVIHAGDFVSDTARRHIMDLAGPSFICVRGNSDMLSVFLPETVALTIEGVDIVVTHPLGVGDASLEADQYDEKILSETRAHVETDNERPTIAIAGHTHRVMDREIDGIHHLNPGSATGAPPADQATMLTLDIDDGDVNVHRCGAE